MKKVIFICLTLFLLVALATSLVLNLYLFGYGIKGSDNEFSEFHLDGSRSLHGDRVAVIDIYGVIGYSMAGELYPSMVEDIQAKLKQAREDDAVKAVLLRIDSPGGEVTASDVIFHDVVKTNKTKPVIAYIDSVGASGAYYSAIGARHIMANELSITASIGVILETMNFQGLGDKVGVQSVIFKSGKMKDLLNPFRPVSPEERTYVQGLIDETYSKFVGLVAKQRHLDEATLRSGIADGRIISGKSAVQEHLIDSTGYFEDAMAKARKLGGLPGDAAVVELQAPMRLGRLLKFLGQAPVNTVQVNLGPESVKLEAGKLYYISQHLFAR